MHIFYRTQFCDNYESIVTNGHSNILNLGIKSDISLCLYKKYDTYQYVNDVHAYDTRNTANNSLFVISNNSSQENAC